MRVRSQICEIEGCRRVPDGRMCQSHRRKLRLYGDPLLGFPWPSKHERFWAKIQGDVLRTDECWVWIGAKVFGYGTFRHENVNIRAHRFAYQSLVGSIPDGLQLDHLCRNRACVNPSHLEPVTLQENVRRGEAGKVTGARARAKTECKHGHPFDQKNTYVDANGRRSCRECVRIRVAERRRRLRNHE